ncbi:hypothetical protein M8994_21430, partial [Brucella sp. 21LCYQ03]|nr:hypothetical protein [Brucella sp. 21LCYQ03]
LTWELFEKSFLPANAKSDDRSAHQSFIVDSFKAEGTQQEVVKWTAQKGMLSTNTNSEIWLVNPVPFSVSVQSVIPTNLVTVSGSDVKIIGKPVGIRPMGYINNLDAPFTIAIVDEGGNEIDLKKNEITLTAITNGAPSALWSKEMLDKKQAPDASTMLIEGALFGLTLAADHYKIPKNLPAFDLSNLEYDDNPYRLLPYALVPSYPAASLYP